jgi:hypothetical protein
VAIVELKFHGMTTNGIVGDSNVPDQEREYQSWKPVGTLKISYLGNFTCWLANNLACSRQLQMFLPNLFISSIHTEARFNLPAHNINDNRMAAFRDRV